METLTVQAPNATKVATKWALIYLITAIILTYAMQFLNLDPNHPVRYVGWVLMIGGLLLTQKEYRDQLGGFMTFSQGFSAGFRYSIFSGLLFAIFMGLYLWILSPDVFAKMMEPTRAAMEQKGTMSSEDMDKAMSMTLKFGPLFASFGIAIMYAIVGAIISLIGAAIFKKERSADDILNALENQKADDLDPTV
jgi:hypothetical protein